ncbi:class I SAM-dependent methyltransferase [Fervidicoccus fontis]|uniref:Methyltransferase n=1 Tax=Fervidicoccus fontis (strain DSM 19380 / JCM 18336 / VKM B-2539 / Kam940) TaxID=1163730 RepID=H9ZZN9_FERFK|nr:DNA cytosine methyltransferase [Fervidicoccus fontis]AFH42196.1 methyltransferase [Fervidicoccus fontis Kam940]
MSQNQLSNNKNLDSSSSFLVIGDIALVNLKNENEIDRGKELAEKILRVNKYIKSVYGKIGTEGEFRVPKIIHLLGEKKTETIAKEYGLLFYVDISKVYYNPRLAEEHHYISQISEDGEVVLDLFSGIGGFSIHLAAAKRAIVFANDINPYAIKFLNASVLLNKKKIIGEVIASNLEANKLLLMMSKKAKFDRIIMNNPTMIEGFLQNVNAVVKTGTTLHIYALIVKDKLEEKVKGIASLIKSSRIDYIKEAIEYSPSKSIYRIDISVQ